MTTSDITRIIEPLLSHAKISPYKTKWQEQWFRMYRYELEKTNQVFAYLHILEVFLRNRINTEFIKDFGDWLCDLNCRLKLNFNEQSRVIKAREIAIKSGKEINQDNIISNLNFRFWTNLFQKSYDNSIWHQNKRLTRVFPFLKNHQRDLQIIQTEMEMIRKFQNKVFHCENLLNYDLEQMAKLINKFIYGISGINVEEFFY
jgi:hypothetical protein